MDSNEHRNLSNDFTKAIIPHPVGPSDQGMALTRPGWAVLVVLLVAATGPVAAADLAPAHETPTAATDATLPATGTPFEDATNTTDDSLDSIDGTTNATVDATKTTNETVDETTESVDETTETVDDTTNSTGGTVEETAGATTNTTEDTTDDATNTTEETTETVDGATETVENTTGTVEDTTGDLESSSLTGTDTVRTDSTLTDSSLTDTTSDTLLGTTETTDDVDGVLSDDGSSSALLSSGSDSGPLVLKTAATTGSGHDSTAGSAGDGGDGDDGDGDSGHGSDGGDAETVVSVETENQQSGHVSRVLGSAWMTLEGFIPEDAPVGPAGATGIGAVALLAVVSRQWFVQSTGSGMPTLLSSGVLGHVGDWVEKLKRLAVPLRYSRYDDSDPLEHDTRRTLHDAIETSPGINLTTLAERTDVPLSTARHHVRVLADEDLVTTAKRRGKRRFYPVGADDVALTDALSEPPKAAVLHALAHHGEARVGLLADELDRDPSTITHHLQALADDGLVERERRGRTVVNRLAESARSALGGGETANTDYAELPADD